MLCDQSDDGSEVGHIFGDGLFVQDECRLPLLGFEEQICGQIAYSTAHSHLPPDSFLGTQAKDKVIPAAHALRLPNFAATEQLIQAGALAGLVSRYAAIESFAGQKAGQILRGGAPRDIPIETLTRYSYLVNFKVAQELKCVPPLSMFSYLEPAQM